MASVDAMLSCHAVPVAVHANTGRWVFHVYCLVLGRWQGSSGIPTRGHGREITDTGVVCVGAVNHDQRFWCCYLNGAVGTERGDASLPVAARLLVGEECRFASVGS